MIDARVLDCIEYFKEIVGKSAGPSTESLALAALRLYQYERDTHDKQMEDALERTPRG